MSPADDQVFSITMLCRRWNCTPLVASRRLIAVERGFLWAYTARNENARAWILTDSARKNAVGRRLDGNVWQSTGRKSKTLSGAWGNWPIGIMEAADYPAIDLAEGTPDFLSVIAHARASGTFQKETRLPRNLSIAVLAPAYGRGTLTASSQ
jgi:hypothetical protein